MPAIAHAPSPDSRLIRSRHRAAKRALDLAVGIPLAILAFPLLVTLFLAVRLSSRGPAFFTQTRVGRGGEPFTVYKLRTMHRRAETHLHTDEELHTRYRQAGFKLHTDPRVTRLGRCLRRCSLDELPQLYQVVLGQMSLVGPRPVLASELEALYGEKAVWYLLVKPGVTGAWQVGGRSNVRGQARVALDTSYVEDWSLRADLSILARTIPTVLSREGAV